MVLSIIIAVAAAPGLLGTQEAIRQSQAKEKREEHRARRCNLVASCIKSSSRSKEINGRPIVLRDGKLYIDTATSDEQPFGHQYAGYYLPYPDESYEGLVTTITDEAPIMNWIYVDKETYEVKHGVRADAQPNFRGPFDCTRQDRRLTFEGWEGWCAVEEYPTIWALYFDRDDNALRSKVSLGTKVLEIELMRKEKRWKKEAEERKEDQTTQRAVDAKGETPTETPVAEESHPGVAGIRPSTPPQQQSQQNGNYPVTPSPARIKLPESHPNSPQAPAKGSEADQASPKTPSSLTRVADTNPQNTDLVGQAQQKKTSSAVIGRDEPATAEIPPMPTIPEEYLKNLTKQSPTASSKIIDAPHPLSSHTTIQSGAASSSRAPARISTSSDQTASPSKTSSSTTASPNTQAPTNALPMREKAKRNLYKELDEILSGGREDETPPPAQEPKSEINKGRPILKKPATVLADKKPNATSASPIRKMLSKTTKRKSSEKKR